MADESQTLEETLEAPEETLEEIAEREGVVLGAWGYRLMRHMAMDYGELDAFYGVVEVYYRKDRSIYMWEEPADTRHLRFLKSPEELQKILERMRAAYLLPPLMLVDDETEGNEGKKIAVEVPAEQLAKDATPWYEARYAGMTTEEVEAALDAEDARLDEEDARLDAEDVDGSEEE